MVAKALPADYRYEAARLTYQIPASTYTPDWISPDGRTIIESKGRFSEEDRRKMRLIRQQFPHLRIIMIFQNPRTRISKRSKTTYEEYARKIGIEVMTLGEVAILLG
nr:endodeoxyribonuclease [Roseicella sp. DB1501]